MTFNLTILPMVASLIVAVLSLTIGFLQTVVALKRQEFNWNKWGAGISFLTAIYAVAVFAQYNLSAAPANILCERIQYTVFILLVHALFGFTTAFLGIESVRRD